MQSAIEILGRDRDEWKARAEKEELGGGAVNADRVSVASRLEHIRRLTGPSGGRVVVTGSEREGTPAWGVSIRRGNGEEWARYEGSDLAELLEMGESFLVGFFLDKRTQAAAELKTLDDLLSEVKA